MSLFRFMVTQLVLDGFDRQEAERRVERARLNAPGFPWDE